MQNIKAVVTMLMLLILGFGAWESIGPYGGYLRSVVVSQTNENLIYVAAYSTPTSIAKTINAGGSWTTVGAIPTQAYCMAIDPLNDNNLYTGCGHSIYRSTNGGANWTSTAMTNKYIYAMAVHPSSPTNVYGSGMSWNGSQWVIAFFKSTNSGTNWTTVTPDTMGSDGYSLAVDRVNPNNIYIGGFYTSTSQPIIYKSTNGGTSFTQITGTIPTTAYYVYSLAVHPTNSNIVYAGTYLGGIYRSTDAGASWTQASTHYYNYSMATSVASPNVAYAGGYSDIYKTTDAGATWFSASTGIAGYYIYGLAASASNANNVYLGDNRGFYKTSNGG